VKHILLILLMVATPIGAQNKKFPTFDVLRPMMVAFFPPVTEVELQHHPDRNEALSDFQEYAETGCENHYAEEGSNFTKFMATALGLGAGML